MQASCEGLRYHSDWCGASKVHVEWAVTGGIVFRVCSAMNRCSNDFPLRQAGRGVACFDTGACARHAFGIVGQSAAIVFPPPLSSRLLAN